MRRDRSGAKEHLKVRGRIEAKFDEQMNRHGLRRARYWGLTKTTIQVLLNAISVNLKRAVKLRMAAGSALRSLPEGAQKRTGPERATQSRASVSCINQKNTDSPSPGWQRLFQRLQASSLDSKCPV